MNNIVPKTNMLEDFKTILNILRDYKKGSYTEFNVSTLILIIFCFTYMISPIDLIPDFLIGGFLDDATVLAFTLKEISHEIAKYKSWEKEKNK